MAKFKPGDFVNIGPAYRGNGHYAPDGHEGIYTVKKFLAPADYKLVRGAVRDVENARWDLICHETRLSLVVK